MAWIKSHQELRNHPKTCRLARFCGIPTAQAIGHLHILWWSALDYAADGDLSTLDDEEIAALAGWDGNATEFVKALCKAGFIDESDGGYAIHDWGEYAGKLVDDREKKREQDRDRAKAYRDRKKDSHTPVTRDDVTCHATVEPVDKTREEKTRVDKSRNTPPSPPALPEPPSTDVDDGTDEEAGGTPMGEPPTEPPKTPTIQQQRFNTFWELYPNKKSKQDAIKAWAKIKPDEALFTRMMNAIRAQLNSVEWHKENGQYIPYPASWLNGGCWDDVVKPMPTGGARADPAPPQEFTPSTGGRTFDDYRSDDSKKS